jgi:hypothetical protein
VAVGALEEQGTQVRTTLTGEFQAIGQALRHACDSIKDEVAHLQVQEQHLFATLAEHMQEQTTAMVQTLETQATQTRDVLVRELQAVTHLLHCTPEVSIRYPGVDRVNGTVPALLAREES